jgi:hypothetical protein
MRAKAASSSAATWARNRSADKAGREERGQEQMGLDDDEALE